MNGSTRKRGSTWTAYWSTCDPATGKRRQHSKGGFRIKADAEGYLNNVLARVADGSWADDKALTVKALLEEFWLPAQRSRDLRPATLVQYAKVVDAWILPYLGATKVSTLKPKTISEWVERLKVETSSRGRDGLSSRSCQLAVGVLKAACAWAVKNELLTRNPVSGVQRPRGTSKVMNSWSVDDARQFLAFTQSDRLSFAWALLLARGLRRGELCGLHWRDVDLDGGFLTINSTRVTVAGKAVDSVPKTAAGRRSVPLDSSLEPVLRAHRTAQSREKLLAGGAYEDDGYLLADALGRPYHPDTISGWFDDHVKASGLPRIRLHDCRHTAASLMLASGVPVKVVSEMLGHASPAITLAIYAHTLPSMSKEAGAALSKSLLA